MREGGRTRIPESVALGRDGQRWWLTVDDSNLRINQISVSPSRPEEDSRDAGKGASGAEERRIYDNLQSLTAHSCLDACDSQQLNPSPASDKPGHSSAWEPGQFRCFVLAFDRVPLSPGMRSQRPTHIPPKFGLLLL